MKNDMEKNRIFFNGEFYSVLSIKSFTSIDKDVIIYLKNGEVERIRFSNKSEADKCIEILG